MNTQNTISHFPEWIWISEFYQLLLSNSKCRHFDEKALQYIQGALFVAGDFHKDELRKVSWLPYITHPIQIALEEIGEENCPHWKSILVYLLHDTLESHPSRFREVFDIVPFDVFCRIVKLSKLSPAIRIEIQEFLFDEIVKLPELQAAKYLYILEMLWHDKKRKEKILTHMSSYDRWAFHKLFNSYGLYLGKNCPDLSQEKKDQEIDGLWHYIFFDHADARHKFRDTMNNLSDVNRMNKEQKERYITRRVPKLQALAFVLLRHGMTDKLVQLQRQWQLVWWRFDHLGNFNIHQQSHELIDETTQQIRNITWG